MHDSANQMDTSPAFSMLPNPHEGFGGAGFGCTLTVVNDLSNHTPVPSPPSAGLYHGPDVPLNASLFHDYDHSLGFQHNSAAFPYTEQPLVLGAYVNNSQHYGYDNYGLAHSQQGHGNGVREFTTSFHNQLDFMKEALATKFNQQAQFPCAQMISPDVDVSTQRFIASLGFHDPPSFGPGYSEQTFSDPTFSGPAFSGPTACDLTASSLIFSGSAVSEETAQGQIFSESADFMEPTYSGQDSSDDAYLPNAYQNMQLTGPDLHIGLASNNSVLPAAPPVPAVQGVAPPIKQQPIHCTQQNCRKSFKRDSDRIRHKAAIHVINQGLHLCPIPGCPKAQGRGYSRADKVTEHLWKKHGNLGFVKRI